MNIQTVSLKDYSSLKIGGEGKMVIVENETDLEEALMHAKTEGLRVHLLGGGTNSYFGEDVSEYLFVQPQFTTSEYIEMEEGSTMLIASASLLWDDIVKESVERGLWGLENLSLIPGTVGSAPIQNIGAYGVELADVFVSLLAYDTEANKVIVIEKDECLFGYRDSIFKQQKGRYIVVSIKLKLSSIPNPVLSYKPLDTIIGRESLSPKDVRELVIATRKSKLPDWREHSNAGSFFKNPVVTGVQGETLRATYPDIPLHEAGEDYKVSTAWLIEHVAAMKGVRRGNVGTWPNQPLVIVNYGDASADEVDSLAQEIRNIILEKTGIILEQEVNRIA